jgi:hypothetical protein
MLNPAPELRDDTPIEDVLLSTRIRNALNAAGLRTVGGGPRGVRRNASQPPRPWTWLCGTSPRDARPAVMRRCQAALIMPTEAEWLRIIESNLEFQAVKRPARPGIRRYPAKCAQCLGKGRIPT